MEFYDLALFALMLVLLVVAFWYMGNNNELFDDMARWLDEDIKKRNREKSAKNP